MMPPAFKPPLYLRSTMVQTSMASLGLRTRGANPMVEAAREIIFDVGPADDATSVRLLASYSPHPSPKGLMVFLHGWEGSQNSSYVLTCGQYIYEAGYSVVRLNYRDHGDSHYLNEGLFYAGRFDEVFQAVRQACALTPDLPAFLTGFSMGGNFALRIVRALKMETIDNIAHIFSISPVINPVKASPVIDRTRLVQRYFMKKWARSLRKKQAFFPELYDFDDVLEQPSVMAMTDLLISKYMNFQTRKDFLDLYRVWPDDLLNAKTPASIIMAKQDPVLPPEDIWELNLPDTIERIMLPYGGHNGFFDSFTGPTWYDRYIKDVIDMTCARLKG